MLGKSASLLIAAVLCAAGMWLYASRVFIPYRVADAALHGRPRGNLSDLYPRWLGARELLLHGRDPYSAAVTREIQAGYYGRPLDSTRPQDPTDQQGFAYPVYMVFFLAPTVHLPFEVVRRGFFWILLILTAVSIPLWLRVLRWPVPLWAAASMVIFTLGSLPVLQGLKLQQMTLLVVALVAVAMALLVMNRPILAGFVLAWATIKPQLVWLLLLWLMIWTLADWRRRYRWAVSFLVTLAVLFATSEWYLPHWIPRFLQAVREYQNYTDPVSVLDKLIPAPWSWLARILAAAAAVHFGWKNRRLTPDAPAFAATVSLALAVTATVIPSYALYNQAMLLPALLILVRERHVIWHRNRLSRLLLSLAVMLLLWPWLASIALAGFSLVRPQEPIGGIWAILPFLTALPTPVGVAGLMLAHGYQRSFPAPTGPMPA
jgi:Glycosyltransferase family 87